MGWIADDVSQKPLILPPHSLGAAAMGLTRGGFLSFAERVVYGVALVFSAP